MHDCQKHFILILSSFFLSASMFAQKAEVQNDPNHDKQAIHFGYSLGLNFMDAYFFPYNWEYIPRF